MPLGGPGRYRKRRGDNAHLQAAAPRPAISPSHLRKSSNIPHGFCVTSAACRKEMRELPSSPNSDSYYTLLFRALTRVFQPGYRYIYMVIYEQEDGRLCVSTGIEPTLVCPLRRYNWRSNVRRVGNPGQADAEARGRQAEGRSCGRSRTKAGGHNRGLTKPRGLTTTHNLLSSACACMQLDLVKSDALPS